MGLRSLPFRYLPVAPSRKLIVTDPVFDINCLRDHLVHSVHPPGKLSHSLATISMLRASLGLLVLTEFVEDLPVSDPPRWARTIDSHKLAATGHHVNLNDDGSLEDVRTGMPLSRI